MKHLIDSVICSDEVPNDLIVYRVIVGWFGCEFSESVSLKVMQKWISRGQVQATRAK